MLERRKKMYKYKISKSFDFCYGHRVYTQDVDPDYAGSLECPCQRIHGHQGKITVEMSIDKLDQRGFVVDFKELSFIKYFIDNNLDHRFIVSVQDPGFQKLVGIDPLYTIKEDSELVIPIHLHSNELMGYRFDIDNPHIKMDMNHLNSFVIVDFNPTSEELAKWIYEGLEKVFDQSPFDCRVESVEWSETPKTKAVYTK